MFPATKVIMRPSTVHRSQLFVLVLTLGLATEALGACSSSGVVETGADAGADAARDGGKTAPKSLCIDGKPSPYPTDTKVDLFGTMPPLELPKLGGGAFAFASRFDPCAPRSHLLILRETASFCGTCLWSQAHTKDVVPADLADRADLVDLVISDKNNVLVRTSRDVERAAKELGEHASIVAADPDYTLQSVGLGDRRLPFYVIVDTRTMVIRRFLADPEPETLASTLRRELAVLDGQLPPKHDPIKYEDEYFPSNHWDMLHDMVLPGPAPKDATNAVADLPAAAALGKDLFSDARLSPGGAVSCATCHAPDKGFADGRPKGVGVAEGDRNTPSILYASHARFQFWDGRADTLWLQATGPIENAAEMGSTRLHVAHRVFTTYRARYEAIFPASPLPPLDDATRFPPAGKPGDASWDTMRSEDKAAVTAIFVRVAKVIEAFERTLSAKPNALDRYIGGDLAALTVEEKVGLHTFFTAGCAQCHYGPRLTDDAFHNIRFATGRKDGKPDLGASVGLPSLLVHELRKPEYADGPFPELVLPTDLRELEGSFRTPPLRGVTATAPYGHGGTLAGIPELAKHYGTAGLLEDDPKAAGRSEAWVPNFVEQHERELVPAMRLFSGEVVVP
ncbi:MAG: cytochrome-c peroxidase [Myxococcales bacterium]|nr:cytochrome-c peroxidase [Myxococcales bacterium]